MINTFFDPEYIKNRWLSFWNRENEDRPLISIGVKKDNAILPPAPVAPATTEEIWLDTEYQVRNVRRGIKSCLYMGEAFPSYSPNLGPDFMGAMCGCDLKFSPYTSWAEPCMDEYETYPDIRFDENNKWWKKMCELTKAAVEESNGDYLIGITDLHPGADTIVSLRGAQNAAMDLYLEPDEFKKRIWEVYDVFREVTERLNGIISSKQSGSTNWMSVYHPEKLWYVTSCDFSYMISNEHFKEFILPELLAEIDWLPATIYHLDGVGSLSHLDTLLSINKLNGVQWVPGNGKAPPREWPEVLKKIQNAGKCVELSCSPEDIIPLCEILDPRGVHFGAWGFDKDSAQALLKEMERVCRQKRGVFPLG